MPRKDLILKQKVGVGGPEVALGALLGAVGSELQAKEPGAGGSHPPGPGFVIGRK